MGRLRGNAIVGQSGGPTAVINQSLVGVIEAAREVPEINKLLGARHGVKGILGEDFIDLFAEDPANLEVVAATPSSALGSVRAKPTAEDCVKMFDVMKKHDVRYFFYIGGNDSAETANIVNLEAKRTGYELRCFHIIKTVDNDLRVTDHCPGYGSAARFVASAFMGDNLDNRALPGIKINVCMGRHAGYLTAAAVLGRRRPDDAPHLVYVPERPVSRQQLLDDVADVYRRLGRCILSVSEGIIDPDAKDAATGAALTYTEAIVAGAERDSHANVQLSGSGALGDWLASHLKDGLKAEFGSKLRVRADTLGYMQRAFPGVVSEVDAREARMCGRKAVHFATTGDVDGSVVMIRSTGAAGYEVDYQVTALANIARETCHLPDEFINAAGNNITPAFLDYALPLTGPLPNVGWLKGME